MHALGWEFGSAAQLSKRPGSVWNCLWGNALKRSPGIIRKSRVSYPGPGFLSSATWPSLPKKHYNGLNQIKMVIHIAMKRGNQATSTTASKHKFKDSRYDKGLIQIMPGIKKILKCSYVLQTSTPKLLLVLLQNNTGHSRKYNFALYLLTCPSDIA